MTTPALLPSSRHFQLPNHQGESTSCFVIRRDGQFGEHLFRAGEHLILSSTLTDGDPVVLVAKGPGRPRLGRVSGSILLGDRGEPCLSTRWHAAGRIVGVARPIGTRWAVEQFDTPDLLGMVVEASETVEASAPSVEQLSLFAA